MGFLKAITIIKRCSGVSVTPFLIFFQLYFKNTFSNTRMQSDSLKTKYAINDPRNPDCPCRKYQKRADKEYRKLIAKEKKKLLSGKNNQKENHPERIRQGKKKFAYRGTPKRYHSRPQKNKPRLKSFWRLFKRDISACESF